MTCVRFIFLCLLMLTVPLRGFAATAMTFCDTGLGHHAPAHVDVDGSSAHHSDTEHKEFAGVSTELPNIQKSLPDAAHKCGVCAACCGAAVINSCTSAPEVRAPGSVMLVGVAVPIYAVHPRQPEKPPRA